MDNKDITALVTGAAKGIGKDIALALASSGIKVALNYHTSDKKALETAAEITSLGGTAAVYQCDITQYESVKGMCKTIKKDMGRVSVLVNNAGITSDCSILRMQVQDWEKVIAANLTGSFYCVKALVFDMMKDNWGRIINIGSLSWYYGAPGQANYAASKAGIVGLTRCLAGELAPHGITVNVVVPGIVPTSILGQMPPEKRKALENRVPAGRLGQGKDIARIVSFLVSEDSGYITGQIIAADGGLTCALGA
jgi:3-oxoacyl-[acyl-carrier protein] reductase